VTLPGGLRAPAEQVGWVRAELDRVRAAIESLSGVPLDDAALRQGIREANRIRRLLAELRRLVFAAPRCPLPALELQIAEMLAIHFCSDRAESAAVLQELLGLVGERVAARAGVLAGDPVRVYWVNPVADIRAMNLLEDCGGRLCGSDFMFCHALDQIPEDVPPLEGLARAALADPMVGPASDRAGRIAREVRELGAEAVVISRIPGASHCATEGGVIREHLSEHAPVPAMEIEVPPVTDAVRPSLGTRIEALVEMARERRKHDLRGG
jgi:benzoyl-CoA reductase/2-hydroxyglutaryl-CoA dehydratase subunit BcrC/BadD/HgdB